MNKNLYLDGMMGLIVGDALGVPVEFLGREKLKKNPIEDMIGYGTYNMPAGSWSDDSSMALATLAALRGGYDPKAIMDNFVAWEQHDEFTPTGVLFDEGNTCSAAIRNYMKSGDVRTCGLAGERDNGNGSLMRILPICVYLYYEQKNKGITDDEAVAIIHEVSAFTHAHLRSKMACGLYFFCVRSLAEHEGSLVERLQAGFDSGFEFYGKNINKNVNKDVNSITEISYFNRLRRMDEIKSVPEDEIRSGGYVIDSIEAAVWCLIQTDSYKDCVLKAVNLGSDTDTTAAIAGGLAGIYYGYEAIPEKWKKTILKREWIEQMCREALQ